ncbi:hypothetical protein BS78_07G126500 [Paspalum vaginatum]|nr:hypothetical protein BS78_07G076800 [Paspalum vaginatum]KAJ1268328.1 hypothetical protein BS78_07G126500 [Paspalum vaginatum]
MPSHGLGGDAAAAARNWADGLGMDALLAIFHRLDHIDILWSVEYVCSTWRRAARDEPSLWRRITMRGHEGMVWWLNRSGVACEAVRRSAGQCEAFCGEYAGDDGFLVYLSEQAPCLKSLRLISCNGVTDEGIAEAVKELPLLEELELSHCYNVLGISEVYEVAGEVCPLLKRFRFSKHRFDVNIRSIPNAFQGIASMHGLRSLQPFGCDLNNDDLETILDSCPHLESLDIRHCFNVNMDDGTLPLKCARIKTVRGPDDHTDDYDLRVESPIRTPIPPIRFGVRSGCPCHSSYSLSDGEDDSDDSSWDDSDYYRTNLDDDSDFSDEPSSYEIDLDEKYDKMLPSSMRTFLKLK